MRWIGMKWFMLEEHSIKRQGKYQGKDIPWVGLTFRLVPDDTVHKGTSKHHKTYKNAPIFGPRSSINI